MMITGIEAEYVHYNVALAAAVLLLGVCYALLISNKAAYRRRQLPPGPPALPFIGNFLPMDVHPGLRNYFNNMSHVYGKIFTIFQGNQPCVVINSHQMAKQLLKESSPTPCVERYPGDILSMIHNQKGLVWSPEWKKQRKTTAKLFRNITNQIQESNAHTEDIQAFIDILGNSSQRPIDFTIAVPQVLSENLMRIFFGSKLIDHHKSSIEQYMQCFGESYSLLAKCNNIAQYPFLQNLPGDVFGWKAFLKSKDKLQARFNHLVRLNSSNSDAENVLSAFTEGRGTAEDIDDADLEECHASLQQLLLASGESVTNVIMWAFLYLSLYPKIQAQVQDEIDSQVGKHRTVVYEDMQSMPFTKAVLYESIRLSRTSFTSLPYSAPTDIKMEGYTIYKGAKLLVYIDGIHHDPAEFADPEAFNPNRFLDEDGDFAHLDSFIPFSIGKRACLGEVFAKMKCFLFVTNVLLKFSISMPGCLDPNKLETQSDQILHKPKPFKIISRERD